MVESVTHDDPGTERNDALRVREKRQFGVAARNDDHGIARWRIVEEVTTHDTMRLLVRESVLIGCYVAQSELGKKVSASRGNRRQQDEDRERRQCTPARRRAELASQVLPPSFLFAARRLGEPSGDRKGRQETGATGALRADYPDSRVSETHWRPLGLSAALKLTGSPSTRVRSPSLSSVAACTKTSRDPSSGSMKPYPFSARHHLTAPGDPAHSAPFRGEPLGAPAGTLRP